MTDEPAWSGGPHVLAARFGGDPLVLSPLPVADAEGLAARFAAIDPWAAYGFPASELAAYFARIEAGAPRFAIRAGANIAGVAGMRLAWLKGPYLQFLGILPEYQGQGIGGAVLDWLDRGARAGLGRNVWVCVSEINASGMAFYERHGFERVASLDDLVRDGYAELLLRKRL